MVDKSLREKEECGRVPARRAAQNVTAGDDGGGEIVRFFARLDLGTAFATLTRQRQPLPSCGGLAPA